MSKNEETFWKTLKKLGLRFQRKNDPEEPAAVLMKERIAVFVDGCFWHGCPEHHQRLTTHMGFWAFRRKAAIARDRRLDQTLIEAGWSIVRIWQHSLERLGGPEDCAVVVRLVAADAVFGQRGIHVL